MKLLFSSIYGESSFNISKSENAIESLFNEDDCSFGYNETKRSIPFLLKRERGTTIAVGCYFSANGLFSFVKSETNGF